MVRIDLTTCRVRTFTLELAYQSADQTRKETEQMRQFYLQWENPQTLSGGFGRRNLGFAAGPRKLSLGDMPVFSLSWSHNVPPSYSRKMTYEPAWPVQPAQSARFDTKLTPKN